MIVNGDEFENIEIPVMSDSSGHSENSGVGGSNGGVARQTGLSPQMTDMNRNIGKPQAQTCDIIVTDTSSSREGEDMMHELVKNKELIKTSRLDKFNSMDSEISEASTLVSTSSDNNDENRKRSRINHHSIRGTLSDSEMEGSTGVRT